MEHDAIREQGPEDVLNLFFLCDIAVLGADDADEWTAKCLGKHFWSDSTRSALDHRLNER
jgi:hypothetical protein